MQTDYDPAVPTGVSSIFRGRLTCWQTATRHQGGMVFQGGSLKRCDDASLAWCCRGVVLSVTGCMHAQQQIEIDDIKKNGYQGQSCENGLRPERTEALVEMQRRNASTHHELIAASAADDVSEGRAVSLPRQTLSSSLLSVEGGHFWCRRRYAPGDGWGAPATVPWVTSLIWFGDANGGGPTPIRPVL